MLFAKPKNLHSKVAVRAGIVATAAAVLVVLGFVAYHMMLASELREVSINCPEGGTAAWCQPSMPAVWFMTIVLPVLTLIAVWSLITVATNVAVWVTKTASCQNANCRCVNHNRRGNLGLTMIVALVTATFIGGLLAIVTAVRS